MTTELSPRAERFFLLTLAGIQFSHVLDFVIMMPLGPILMTALAIGTDEFGLLVASYSFSAAASGILAATFVDRFERKRVLLISFALFGLATLACGLAPGYSTLLLARGMAGVFGGIMGSLIHTMIADAIPFSRRARASGIVSSAFSISTIAGVPLSLWLANHFGWRAPFMLIAALSVAFIVIGLRFLPELRQHLGEEKRAHLLSATFSVLGEANHRRALLFSALVIFSGFTVIPYITVYAVNNVGIPLVEVPIIYLVGGSATFISARLIGHWADKIRQGRGLSPGGLAGLGSRPARNPCRGAAAVGLADLFDQLLRADLRADDPGHGGHRLVGPAQAARHLHVAERHRAVAGHGAGHDAGRLFDLARRQRSPGRLSAGWLRGRGGQSGGDLVCRPHRHARAQYLILL
jgi:predicted MFS family arabinose efflux permease